METCVEFTLADNELHAVNLTLTLVCPSMPTHPRHLLCDPARQGSPARALLYEAGTRSNISFENKKGAPEGAPCELNSTRRLN